MRYMQWAVLHSQQFITTTPSHITPLTVKSTWQYICIIVYMYYKATRKMAVKVHSCNGILLLQITISTEGRLQATLKKYFHCLNLQKIFVF